MRMPLNIRAAPSLMFRFKQGESVDSKVDSSSSSSSFYRPAWQAPAVHLQRHIGASSQAFRTVSDLRHIYFSVYKNSPDVRRAVEKAIAERYQR